MRILSKGANLEVADVVKDWDEQSNIKDYDLVFVDFTDLIERKNNFMTRGRKSVDNDVVMPEKDDVKELIKSGGDLVILFRNKEQLIVKSKKRRTNLGHSISRVHFFNWLPIRFNIEKEEAGGQSLENVRSEWGWYYEGDFEWKLWFTPKGNSSEYKDFDLTDAKHHDLLGLYRGISSNSYEKDLAFELKAIKNEAVLDGSIYVLQRNDSFERDKLAKNILRRIITSNKEEEITPEWLDGYTLRNEKEILDKIKSLRNRLEGMQRYKELLYEANHSLEDVVYESLRDIGFEVEEEEKMRRDGLVYTDDKNYVLEIHGTKGAIPETKCSQLNKYVSNYIKNSDESKEVGGILVVNSKRDEDPQERNNTLPDSVEELMDHWGYKILPTVELFKAIKGLKNGDIEQEEIIEKISGDKARIEFTSIDLM